MAGRERPGYTPAMDAFPPRRPDPRAVAAGAREARTGRGRKLAPADPAITALAISGMTLYWMLPVLARQQKKRGKRPPRTSPPA